MQWRKRWARNWEHVKVCSDACRRRGRVSADEALEAAILKLAATRGAHKTLCPSEVSREVFGAEAGLQPEAMEQTRAAARRLVAAGRVDIVQKGRVVDPSRARGPIRIRLRDT